MPDIILPNLGLELPDIGSDQDTWGNILNADLQTLDKAVQYDVISKTLAGVDVTLTDVEAASSVIDLSGTITANVNVIVPSTPVRLYLVRNRTSGAFTVTIKTAAGTGTDVQQGTSSLVYSDGTNIIQGATSVNGSFAVSGALSTGSTTVTGALSAGSLSTASATITGGSINSIPIGNTTPSTGAFTTLSASGATTLNGTVTLGDAAGDTININGTPTFVTEASFAAGTSALPSITRTGDLNTGIFFPAADTVGVSTAGSECARITSGSNVLIGTTADDGVTKLQVAGNVSTTTFVGSLSGNASSATILQTARTINGVSFNGSANISINLNNSLTAGNGLTGTTFNGGAASTFAIGTPTSVSNTSTNSVTATSHTHALDGELVATTAGSAAHYGARAFVNFNGTGTVSIRNSQNVSSITDNAVGAYTVNLGVGMPDANYSVNANAGDLNSSATVVSLFRDEAGNIVAPTVAAFGIITSFDMGPGQRSDNAHVCVSVFR